MILAHQPGRGGIVGSAVKMLPIQGACGGYDGKAKANNLVCG